MQRVLKSVLVPYSAARMFELVDDVEHYPEFLPWCGGAQAVREASRRQDRAHRHRLSRRQGALHHRQRQSAPESIVITLKDGPFRHLHGEWRFRALAEDACKVEFELAYEFSTHLLETVVGPVFSHIANTFIDAFVRRAEAVYPKPQ